MMYLNQNLMKRKAEELNSKSGKRLKPDNIVPQLKAQYSYSVVKNVKEDVHTTLIERYYEDGGMYSNVKYVNGTLYGVASCYSYNGQLVSETVYAKEINVGWIVKLVGHNSCPDFKLFRVMKPGQKTKITDGTEFEFDGVVWRRIDLE